MAEKFPRTAAGLPNAQLEFDREKEQKMGAFIYDFMKEYELSGIPATEMLSMGFGWLGAFIHLALFYAWSDEVCKNKSLPLNSQQFVSLEGMLCQSCTTLQAGPSKVRPRHKQLQLTRGHCTSCLWHCILLMSVQLMH
jgi:hypothetical protein